MRLARNIYWMYQILGSCTMQISNKGPKRADIEGRGPFRGGAVWQSQFIQSLESPLGKSTAIQVMREAVFPGSL